MPLIPGLYIDVQEGRTLWIDFRYEGVYLFCKRCGRIGHKSSSCSPPWSKAKSGMEKAIAEACKPETPIILGNPNASLQIIGLPHTFEVLTTIVKLNEPRRPPEFSSSSSNSDDNDEGDDDNHISDAEMRNASSNNGSKSKHGNNSDNSQNGPAKRPKSIGPRSKNFEKGEPSLLPYRVGRTQLQATNRSIPCTKGNPVLSIKQKSFKKIKRNTSWHLICNDDDVSLFSSTN